MEDRVIFRTGEIELSLMGKTAEIPIWCTRNRSSYTSAHVLLNLLSKLGEMLTKHLIALCKNGILLSCEPRVTVTSCFVYNLIRDL